MSWDDDDFDVEHVFAMHCAERATRVLGTSATHGDESGEAGEELGENWLRCSYLNMSHLALPKYLEAFLPCQSRVCQSGSFAEVTQALASRGRAIVHDIDGQLLGVLQSMAEHGFEGAKLDASLNRDANYDFSASSLAVLEMVTFNLVPPSTSGACSSDVLPQQAASSFQFVEKALGANSSVSSNSVVTQIMSSYLTQHVQKLAGLSPQLNAMVTSISNGSTIDEYCACVLQVVRMQALDFASCNVAEQYLCHSQVEVGLLTLIVPFSTSVEAHIASATEPDVAWERHRLSGITSSSGHTSGILVVGRTLERLAGIPAPPWCIMSESLPKKAAQVCAAIIRLCPRVALGAEGIGMAIGPLLSSSVRSSPGLAGSCMNEHLSDDLIFSLLLYFPLRQALRIAAVARVFASAKVLARRIDVETLFTKDARHIMRATRLLQEVDTLDLRQFSELPPFAAMRVALLAAPKLRKLRLPHWPGVAKTLQKIRPRVQIEVALASDAPPTISQSDFKNSASLSGPSPDAHLVVNRFLNLFPWVLEEIPEWRRCQTATIFTGTPGKFASWLVSGGRRQPPLLILQGVDISSPILAMSTAAAKRCHSTVGFALYFDGERLDTIYSLENYGINCRSMVQSTGNAIVHVDAVELANDA